MNQQHEPTSDDAIRALLCICIVLAVVVYAVCRFVYMAAGQ